MSEIEDRPASLQRRRPTPAPDESIDPVDYQTKPAPAVSNAAASTRDLRNLDRPPVMALPSFEPPAPLPSRRGRPRGRELTVPFSTRISQDISELIDAASDEQGLTQRSVIEIAVREYWGVRARDGQRES